MFATVVLVNTMKMGSTNDGNGRKKVTMQKVDVI